MLNIQGSYHGCILYWLLQDIGQAGAARPGCPQARRFDRPPLYNKVACSRRACWLTLFFRLISRIRSISRLRSEKTLPQLRVLVYGTARPRS